VRRAAVPALICGRDRHNDGGVRPRQVAHFCPGVVRRRPDPGDAREGRTAVLPRLGPFGTLPRLRHGGWPEAGPRARAHSASTSLGATRCSNCRSVNASIPLGITLIYVFEQRGTLLSVKFGRVCSENSVKFSIRSSSRVRSQVPRSITSSDTRRGSSSRSMRFHSKNRSQSAVSEPMRLSVPFEAMSSALNQNNAGIWCL
jgi:hypothetical protein